jgi:RNA polymerase sigma-70 factor (ECF subfamily)
VRALADVAEGRTERFRVVLDAYGDAIHGFVLRMLRNPADAADATQETMLRAFRSAAGFDAREPLRPWLYRIARNVCLDMLARRRKDSTAAASIVQEPDLHTRDDRLVARERIAQLDAAHDRLDTRSKEVLVLRHVEGLDYAEVAGVTGDSEGSLRVRLHRAKEKLRTLLEGHVEEAA